MTHKPLDIDVLNALLDSVGGDHEFLQDLVETFFQDAPLQFSSMQTALEQNDPETFRRAAHSLKSNSASFGATHLAQICKQLEDIGKSGQLGSASPLLQDAEMEFDQVKEALQKVVDDR